MTYKMNCDQGDDFMIESEDEQEVIEHVKQHAREKHDMDVSDDEARERISQAS